MHETVAQATLPQTRKHSRLHEEEATFLFTPAPDFGSEGAGMILNDPSSNTEFFTVVQQTFCRAFPRKPECEILTQTTAPEPQEQPKHQSRLIRIYSQV